MENLVIGEEKLAEIDEIIELFALEELNDVIAEIEELEIKQTEESVVADDANLAVVEIQVLHPRSPEEDLTGKISHVVAVEEDAGGVHGDEGRNLAMASGGALDDVGGPGGVVETGAAIWALHAAVAPEEIAAHA